MSIITVCPRGCGGFQPSIDGKMRPSLSVAMHAIGQPPPPSLPSFCLYPPRYMIDAYPRQNAKQNTLTRRWRQGIVCTMPLLTDYFICTIAIRHTSYGGNRPRAGNRRGRKKKKKQGKKREREEQAPTTTADATAGDCTRHKAHGSQLSHCTAFRSRTRYSPLPVRRRRRPAAPVVEQGFGLRLG